MKKTVFILNVLFSLSITAQDFKLPILKYDYDALSSSIDSVTMRIHYSKHHQGYVNNLNKALENSKDENLSLEDILLNISSKSIAVRNNAGGHFNHTLFWEILTPKTNTLLSPTFEKAVNENFESIEELKLQLNKAAASQFGSGWAWLVLTPNGKLAVTSSPNQDNPLMNDVPVRGIPLIGIDVWEHAYYLKYQNKRGDYLGAIWNIINWEEVSLKYENAIKSELLQKLK
jgi:superoxide dismutase, Fe-Mn family